jgi:sigma-B regulation protein RsbU (phosphoserine phosphatase)
LAKYDTQTRTLNYINAGHSPPVLVVGDEVSRLKNGCTVLGWLPELPFLETGGICLRDEALVFSFTDGLTDVQNTVGEPFGEDNLVRFMQANAGLSAEDLNKQLLHHIEIYRESEPFPDDITVLTCKFF